MTGDLIITSKDEADLFLDDGGVASFHHNGENMLTTYYQDRVDQDTLSDDESIWDVLSEGKQYCKDWHGEHELTQEMIDDAVAWLGFDPKKVNIIRIEMV